MINRRLGYLVLLFMAVAGIALGAYLVREITHPANLRVVAFSSAGNLNIEDPVKMLGLEVGQVADMKSVGDAALITLRFYQDLPIHVGYSIRTVDKGILGERMITLDPGNSSLPRVAATDTLHGHFQPGISELVGQAWKLKAKITEFRAISTNLLNGADSTDSFVERFETIVDQTETFTRQIAGITGAVHATLGGQMQSLESMIITAEDLISTSAALTPEYIATIEEQITKVFSTLSSLQKLSADMQNVIAALQSKDSPLMGEKAATLQQSMQKLITLSRQLRQHGFNLKILLSLRR